MKVWIKKHKDGCLHMNRKKGHLKVCPAKRGKGWWIYRKPSRGSRGCIVGTAKNQGAAKAKALRIAGGPHWKRGRYSCLMRQP